MMTRLISAIPEILVWILVQALRRSQNVWITGAMSLRFAAFLIIKPPEESLIHNFLAVSLYALAAFSSYYIPLRIYEWFDEQLKAMDRRFNELAGKSFYQDNITLACRLFCRYVTAMFMQLLSLYVGLSKEYPEGLVCWIFGLWSGSVVLISYGTMTADDYGVAATLIGIVLNKLKVWVAVLLVINQASRIIIIPLVIKFNIWYGDPPCPRVWDPELPISNPSSSLATFHKTCTTNSSNVAPPPRDQIHESPPATTSEAPQSPTPNSSTPADQTHESPLTTTSEAPQSPTPQSSPADQTHESPPMTTSEAPQSPTPQSSPPADQTVV